MIPDADSDATTRLLSDLLKTDPPAEVEGRLRSQLDALRARMESVPLVRSDRDARRRPWRVGAAALVALSAVVLLAIVLWPLGSSRALAQIVAAVAAKPWLHARGTGPDGQRMDLWFSADRGILAWHSGESFLLVDQDRQTMEVFGPPDDSGAIQRLPLEFVPTRGIDAARQGFLALLTGDLRRAMKSGDQQVLEHQQQAISIEGRGLFEHRFVVGRAGDAEPRVENVLTVDPETALPIAWRMKLGNQQLGDFKVTYPERGPLTMAALGVPDSAPIVDQTPRGEFKNVLRLTNTARRRFDAYHAVVIDSPSGDRARHGTWCQIWRKGDCWRIDRGQRMFHNDEVPPPGVDAESWWLQQAKLMRSYPREIWDGKRLWTFEPNYPTPRRNDAEDPHAVAIDSLTVSCRLLPDPQDPQSNSGVMLPEYFGYASLNRGVALGFRAETRMDTLDDLPMTVVDIFRTLNKSPKSTSPERFWLDPQRGSMIVRKEYFLAADPQQAVGISEVVAAARTPQGLWYPKTVRHIGNSVSLEDNSRSDWYDRYYLEFTDDIPDHLFQGEAVDPKNFWTVVKSPASE
ncbi:MAG: hypothetical protein JSS02_26175 [Planctomycetes bacterium]|nr:hypothetical protein [Planctomycetota bacterium]